MALPIKIAIGMVSIYGSVSSQDIFNENPNGDARFGVVNGLHSPYSSVSIGQSVIYNKYDLTPVFYVDTVYYLVPEDKITAVENPLMPPP